MYDKVDLLSEEFEYLKDFCFRIGEGRLEPQMEELHFFFLYHPTVEGAFLAVHWDAGDRHFYIREAIEGFPIDEFPLVHSFPLTGRSIFPDIVEIQDETALYSYAIGGGYAVEAHPRKQYLRLELLFDEKNPIPWEERK